MTLSSALPQSFTPMIMSIVTPTWLITATPPWAHFHTSHSLTTMFLFCSHPLVPDSIYTKTPDKTSHSLVLSYLLCLIHWYPLFPPYPAYSLANNYNQSIPLYSFISLAPLSRYYTCSGKTTLVKPNLLLHYACSMQLHVTEEKHTTHDNQSHFKSTPWDHLLINILYSCHRVCLFKEPKPREGI